MSILAFESIIITFCAEEIKLKDIINGKSLMETNMDAINYWILVAVLVVSNVTGELWYF